MDISMMTERQLASFESKIDRSGDCWLWSAGQNNYGYGHFVIGSHKEGTEWQMGAHRLAWMLAHPALLLTSEDCVCHHCDVRLCCKPGHLFRGTQADNIRDMMAKGRLRANVGARNGQSKLTEADIPVIRASKETRAALAARYGVAVLAIGKVQRRQSWSHVA